MKARWYDVEVPHVRDPVMDALTPGCKEHR